MSDDDTTYRFDPTEFREDGETGGPETLGDASTPDGPPGAEDLKTSRGATPDDGLRRANREFGWRGWVLVGMLLVAFVVIPVLLYFVPRAQWLAGAIGLGYRDAFLVLPLIPALLLGALAVWATTRP